MMRILVIERDLSVDELYITIELDVKTDEAVRILLTEKMKEALRNAEQSLA